MHLRRSRKLSNELSLNEALEQDEDNASLSLMDVLKVEDTMLEDISCRDDCQRVRAAVFQHLEGRERMVMIRRYGLDGKLPQTQREVAQTFGISRSYVSRIEKKALKKLEVLLEE